MMERVSARALLLVDQQVDQFKAGGVATLAAALPEDVVVTETSEGIVLRAKGLSPRLLEDSGLRDVAFLMQRVR